MRTQTLYTESAFVKIKQTFKSESEKQQPFSDCYKHCQVKKNCPKVFNGSKKT